MELSHSPSYSLLKVENDEQISGKLHICINPCFRITNCLPIPIQFFLFSSKDEKTLNLIKNYEELEPKEKANICCLKPQAEYNELSFSLKIKLSLYLKIPGFEINQPFSLYDPKDKNFQSGTSNYKMHWIKLRSSESELIGEEQDSSSLIYIIEKLTTKGDELTTRDFYIYVKTCLFNQTYQSLDFYGYDRKTKKKTKICKGDLSMKSSIGKIFLLNQQENLLLGLKGYYQETSNEVCIKQNGSYSLELKTAQDYSYHLYEYAVNVSTLKSGFF